MLTQHNLFSSQPQSARQAGLKKISEINYPKPTQFFFFFLRKTKYHRWTTHSQNHAFFLESPHNAQKQIYFATHAQNTAVTIEISIAQSQTNDGFARQLFEFRAQ